MHYEMIKSLKSSKICQNSIQPFQIRRNLRYLRKFSKLFGNTLKALKFIEILKICTNQIKSITNFSILLKSTEILEKLSSFSFIP